MGEDIGVFNGAYKVTAGLLEEFGEKRVRDTPISENTIVGMGVGAAMLGLRPVVELMTINFSLLALDQIVNHAAHIHYMFGGQVKRAAGGAHAPGRGPPARADALALAGSRSTSTSPACSSPCPSTAADAKGLLKAAIRDDNPVVFIEHEFLYGQRGDVPDDEDHVIPFGKAAIRREGQDVTIIGISRMAITAERAAEQLAERHEIDAEVIDPRTLRPLDLDTILASVRKTNRCVIVEEGWPHGGVGANLAALIQEQAFDHLDAPDPPRHRRRRADALRQEPRADRLPPRARSHRRRALDLRPGTSDHGRDRHATPVGLDGGGHDHPLAQGARARRSRAARSSWRSRPTRRR